MYDNIGGKIKGLSVFIFLIELIAVFIIGIILMTSDNDFILIGLLVIILGALFSWVSSWLLYGFGELIAKTDETENNTRIISEYIIAEQQKHAKNAAVACDKSTNNTQSNLNPYGIKHGWLCTNCQKMRSQSPCEHCGHE